jgi:hypothetical protein
VPRLRTLLRRMAPAAAFVAVCMLAATVAATTAMLGSRSAILEANVSSHLAVDYSADEVALKIPRLSPEIVDAARRDLARLGSDAASPERILTPSPGPGNATVQPSFAVTPTPTPRTTNIPPPTLDFPLQTFTLPPVPTLPPTPALPPVPTTVATPIVSLPGVPPTPTLPPLPPLP